MFALTRRFQNPVRQRRPNRKGGAVVETAFCIPLVILLMLGTLEVCAGLYLYESCKVAGFEGIRLGIRRGGTPEEVIFRANEVLTSRGITYPQGANYGVFVTPSDFSDLNALDPITVTISVPTEGNSIFIFDTLANRKIQASVTMVREFDE